MKTQLEERQGRRNFFAGRELERFNDEETLNGMIADGMSKVIAEMYVEMGRAIGGSVLFEDPEAHKPGNWSPAKLSDFDAEFAAAYHAAK